MATITPVRARRLALKPNGRRVSLDVLNLYLQGGNARAHSSPTDPMDRYGRAYNDGVIYNSQDDVYGIAFYGQAGNYTVTYGSGEIVARLPTVGGDIDAWGTVLNTYLAVFLNSDGSVKFKGKETITLAAESYTVTLPYTADNANYIVTATPCWNTTVWVPTADQSTTQFIAYFNTPPSADDDNTLFWTATEVPS